MTLHQSTQNNVPALNPNQRTSNSPERNYNLQAANEYYSSDKKDEPAFAQSIISDINIDQTQNNSAIQQILSTNINT